MVRRVVELVELNEVTVTNCGGDMADTVVLVVSAGKNKKHADEMGLLVLHGVDARTEMVVVGTLRAADGQPRRAKLLRLRGASGRFRSTLYRINISPPLRSNEKQTHL